ncbi:hypothetical protein, partial [Rhizobium leguminosarum]|uniref:hypothetical protein n=1 Tax=Rhizobium leguminosarum TaxID=384 RepID=UPI003F9B0BFF
VAQSATPASPQPESVQRFIGMFSDPDVQRFLQQQSEAAKAVTEPPVATPNAYPSFSEFAMRLLKPWMNTSTLRSRLFLT